MGGQRRHGWLTVELTTDRPMLLLQLSTALSLLSLDALSFLQRQHLLVLHTQLSPLQLVVIEMIDNLGCLIRRGEVGEGKTTEDSVVEVIVEGIG